VFRFILAVLLVISPFVIGYAIEAPLWNTRIAGRLAEPLKEKDRVNREVLFRIEVGFAMVVHSSLAGSVQSTWVSG
jgi:hypothetical protein